MSKAHNYYVYIITNKNKTVLYVGVTNNIETRLMQHKAEADKPVSKTFAGRYNCCYLLYYEWYGNINVAISREKELKGWRREKKEALIATTNPEWNFLQLSE